MNFFNITLKFDSNSVQGLNKIKLNAFNEILQSRFERLPKTK
jgi:hypothetical protein